MSWDSYVETLKGYSVNGAISEAAIVGKADGALWTSETENLKALDGQALKLIVGKKSESITINGVRFMYLRVIEDDDGTFQILYKKKDVGALCVAVTGQAIIVSLTSEAMSYASGESNEATRKIAAYLIGLGY
jgi:hypothetical protein